jgi:hypothetical protein
MFLKRVLPGWALDRLVLAAVGFSPASNLHP